MAVKAESSFSLKDQLFNAQKVDELARRLESVHPGFPGRSFRTTVLEAFPGLELKQRIAHITRALHVNLPRRYPHALGVILDALPAALDPERSDGDFGDFIFAPFGLFVATHGCTAGHLEISLDALRQITKRFSAEDAVRYFLNAFPRETLAFLHECARDEHYHVRRLASEGTRPRLPWSQRLTIDYREPLPILDMLFADPTRYVTRSVANHLNDISRLDPDLVIDRLTEWRDSSAQSSGELHYITNHALRTLVKQAHGGALELIGFGGKPAIEVAELTTSTPRVRIGEAFRFTLTLRAKRRQKLLIDYVMTFAGDGRGTGRKVFKLKQLELGAGETVTLSKAHAMRPMTTRRLHAGRHEITLQVNGRPLARLAFDLVLE